jgi:integrase
MRLACILQTAVLVVAPRADGKVFGLEPDSISQAFDRACKRAEIQNLHFHDLRHEAASRFFEIGFGIMEVASITGHKDLKMLRRYTHLRAEDLAKKFK